MQAVFAQTVLVLYHHSRSFLHPRAAIATTSMIPRMVMRSNPWGIPVNSRFWITLSTFRNRLAPTWPGRLCSTRWVPISGGSGSKCGPSQCRQGVAGSPLHDNGRRPRNHGGRPATRPQHRQKPADAYQRCSPHPPPPHPALGRRNCQLPLYFTD
jgi:hypothetical protein